MKAKLLLLGLFSFVVWASSSVLAQSVVITRFNGAASASHWTTSTQDSHATIVLADSTTNQDPVTLGSNNLYMQFAYGGYTFPASPNWGKASLTLPQPVDISGATDVKIRMNIVRPSNLLRAVQIKVTLHDGSNAYDAPEQIDELYNVGAYNDGGVHYSNVWYTYAIPLSNFMVSGSNRAGAPASVSGIDITLSEDGHSLADTIGVLFGDMEATAQDTVNVADNYGVFLGFEPSDVAALTAGFSSGVATDQLIMTNDASDAIEGNSCMKVVAAIPDNPNSWGSWTDAGMTLPAVDLNGATEIRFWIKVVKPCLRNQVYHAGTVPDTGSGAVDAVGSANLQFDIDLWDSVQTDTTPVVGQWRWLAGGGGVYSALLASNKNDGMGGWNEVAVPIEDFGQVNWYAGYAGEGAHMDLSGKIVSFHLGVYGDAFYNKPDTAIFLLDNMYATSSGVLTGVRKGPAAIPNKFGLSDNYPNPFNPSTTIKISLPQNGLTSLKIYNDIGQLVMIVDEGFKLKGDYNFNVNMEKFASGVYFYTLRQGANITTKKMVLLK